MVGLIHIRASRLRRLLPVLLAAAAAASGCDNAIYKASKLPLEYSATRVGSPRKVDLARLSRATMRSEQIYVGDVLEVTIATGLEDRTPLNWSLRVSDSGEILVPLVGPVRVVGLLLTDAEQMIRQESVARKVYRDPHVSVLLKTRKTVKVTVVGAVQRPGAYDLPAANNDLLSALMAAGGLTEKAATIVEIRGTGGGAATGGDQRPTSAAADPVRIDLIAASEGITPEYQIRDGSVIMVREQDPKKIQVIGLVRKADQFEIPRDQEIRLLDAIALANGRTMELADKVHVIRNIEQGQKSIVIAASVREAKRNAASNILLAPGDVVSVEETPLTFTVGTIREFIRFGFSSAIPGF